MGDEPEAAPPRHPGHQGQLGGGTGHVGPGHDVDVDPGEDGDGGGGDAVHDHVHARRDRERGAGVEQRPEDLGQADQRDQ